MDNKLVVLPHMKWLFTPWVFLGAVLLTANYQVVEWLWWETENHFLNLGDIAFGTVTMFLTAVAMQMPVVIHWYLYKVTSNPLILTTKEERVIEHGQGDGI